ncbi:hypothetical protein [Confluentibacter citreus]|uniref:hypothetical protein n=1 Tax=Confluentibacter citreus TaxID=2007307 RepID=UPI001EFE4536|nr:hypothetical protein [Confluentibacter citreus]
MEMHKDDIDKLFDDLKNDFDVEIPNSQHTQKFLNKLNNKGGLHLNESRKQRRRLWYSLSGIAASIVLIISLFTMKQQTDSSRDLASVSPQMAETQDFFTNTINHELEKIKNESDPEVQLIIKDAFFRIKKLEKDYESLTYDLHVSGNDNRVIYAMISNFQSRIDILKNTLEQINNVKQLKNKTNETSSTI